MARHLRINAYLATPNGDLVVFDRAETRDFCAHEKLDPHG